MAISLRIGEMHSGHRQRVADILCGNGIFNDAEVSVALELFDEVFLRDPALRITTRDPYLTGSCAPHPDYCFLGAFTAIGELVGYACYGPTPSTDRTFDLYWIAVDPTAQRSGAGTLLLTEVERRVAARNARLLIVETSSRPEYEPTRAFYVARAYDEAARVGSFYAPGDDRVIYTKRVQAAPEGRGVAAQ